MKIRSRFILLITALVVIFAAICAFTFLSFKRIEHLNSIDRSVHELYALSLEMRKTEDDFLNHDLINPLFFETGSCASVQKFDSIYNKAFVLCGMLKSLPDVQRMGVVFDIDEIRLKLSEYQVLFVALQKEKREFGFKDWGLEGQIRQSIHKVESRVNELDMPRLKVHMLMLRRHEKDYLLRRDIAYHDRFNNELESMLATLYKSQLSKDQKNEIEGLLINYKKSFLLLLVKDQLIGVSRNEGAMARLETTVGETIGAISKLNQFISESTNSYINRVLLILITFIIICTLIASAFGLYIFNRIVNIMGGEPEDVALITNSISKGNLQIRFDSTDEYKGIMHSVVVMTRKLSEIISGIYRNSHQVVHATQQFAATSQLVSEGASAQAISVDEISAAIDDVKRNAISNSENARETEKLAAIVKAGIGSVKKQADLSLETNKAITEKIGIINHITKQTKLLALNASVEAARAGIHGSGFHVIAEEVKRLAEMTEKAAGEINHLTRESLEESQNVNKLINTVLKPVDKSAFLVQQIAEASEEQGQAVSHVLESINSLYRLSQENAAVSEEMAASTEELDKQTKHLKEIISYFEFEIDINDGENIVHIQSAKMKKKRMRKLQKKVGKGWRNLFAETA